MKLLIRLNLSYFIVMNKILCFNYLFYKILLHFDNYNY